MYTHHELDQYGKMWKYNTPTKTGDVEETLKRSTTFEVDDLPIFPRNKLSILLSAVGVLPSNTVWTNWKEKLLIATVLSTLISAVAANTYFLSGFILLSIANFIISALWERKMSFREKISAFVADYVLVFLIGGVTSIFFEQFTIPFINKSIPFLSIISLFMIVHYVYSISRIIYPITSLKSSKTLIYLLRSCKYGLEQGKDKFEELNMEDVMRDQMN